MILNTHPEDRKAMAGAIAERLGLPCTYMRLPTYAFKIGEVTVNKDGTTESENTELLKRLKPMLIENGWLGTEETDVGTSKQFPRVPMPEPTLFSVRNLIRTLYTKQRLINRMARLDWLSIAPAVIDRMADCTTLADLEAVLDAAAEEKHLCGLRVEQDALVLTLPCDEEYPERRSDMAALMRRTMACVQNAKRVHASIQEPQDNEKYMANAWLYRLGFGGPEHKELRRRLMQHLSGYAAFRNNERMRAHREKLYAKRHEHRETKEVNPHE